MHQASTLCSRRRLLFPCAELAKKIGRTLTHAREMLAPVVLRVACGSEPPLEFLLAPATVTDMRWAVRVRK